jgi:hypothetical protein
VPPKTTATRRLEPLTPRMLGWISLTILDLTHDPRPYPGKTVHAGQPSDLACDQPATATG